MEDPKDNTKIENNPEEYHVLDDRVEFSFQKGMLSMIVNEQIWIFPISQLMSDDIMYIREIIEIKNDHSKKNKSKHVPPHACPGCITIPTNGFSSYKFNWCRFSRTIARLQEEYVPKAIEKQDSKVDAPLLQSPKSIDPSLELPVPQTRNVWDFIDLSVT